MTDAGAAPVRLDPEGFNELRMCRDGPMLYNRYDRYVGQSLRKYGEFSPGERELFQQVVRPGVFVVEVGANIGAHTVALSRLVGPRGWVFAFEPQRIAFQTLCANLALNQCVNVEARQAALGAASGSIQVPDLDPRLPNNFGGVALQGFEGGDTVPLVTLDSLRLAACHLLKVDVEGMEVDVLRGAVETIAARRPMLYLENDRADRSAELLGCVLDLGYAAYWHLPPLFSPRNFAGDPEDIFPGIASVNVFCVPLEAAQDIRDMRRVSSAADTWRG